MKNDTILAALIEQWPELKKRADEETDRERLSAIVLEIDDFLLRLEARVVKNDQERLRENARSDNRAVRPGIGSP